jgi:hypothetical protein
VGTVGKRSLFFPGFHSPYFCLAVSSKLALFNRQPAFVDDGKAVKHGFPVVHRHGPFLRDVAQRQVEQFEDCLVIVKRAARFRRSAATYSATQSRWSCRSPSESPADAQERSHAGPVAAPGLRNRWKLRIKLQAKLGPFVRPLLRFGGVDWSSGPPPLPCAVSSPHRFSGCRTRCTIHSCTSVCGRRSQSLPEILSIRPRRQYRCL